MNKWLLVYCKARQESVVVENLEAQGFSVYCPTIKKEFFREEMVARKVIEPLFPTYVFLNVDPKKQSVAPVRSTRGVRRIVRFGDQYVVASNEIVDQIKTKVDEKTMVSVKPKQFKSGDVVRVRGGGFGDVKAIFSSDCGNERVSLLMNILGRDSKVSVPRNLVST